MNGNRFTPTERRLLERLADGLPHTYPDLLECLSDGLAGKANLQNHISRIRPNLRKKGQDILCVFVHRRRCYQWVRLLANPYR